MLAVWGLSATASVAAALRMLYPNLAGQFGSLLTVGTKADFPAAKPSGFMINQAGVFYRQSAKTYVIHLHKDTQFSLHLPRKLSWRDEPLPVMNWHDTS